MLEAVLGQWLITVAEISDVTQVLGRFCPQVVCNSGAFQSDSWSCGLPGGRYLLGLQKDVFTCRFHLSLVSRWASGCTSLGECREDPGSAAWAALVSISLPAVCCPEADAGQAKHRVSSKPACSWSYASKVLQKQREEAQSWAPGCYLWLSYCVTLSSSLHLWVTALPPQLPGSGMATPTSSARVSCGAILQLIECRKRVFPLT